MARDLVKRNVVSLCTVPKGQPGRRSKALSLAQAEAILCAAEGTRMYAYIVVSLLTGARTEELRALTWDHVDLDGNPSSRPPIPLTLPSGAPSGQAATQRHASPAVRLLCPAAPLMRFCCNGTSRNETAQLRRADGANTSSCSPPLSVLLSTRRTSAATFRKAIAGAPGLDPDEWTPRELRHSFVSLLSDRGVPLEEISRLVGRSTTAVTELVYRQQIRPVLQSGAAVMDSIFGSDSGT